MRNRREKCIVKRLYYKIMSQDEVINIFRIKESSLLECFKRKNYIWIRAYLYHSVEHHKRIFYLNKELGLSNLYRIRIRELIIL